MTKSVLFGFLAACVVGATASSQDAAGPGSASGVILRVSVDDVVRMATANNTALKVAFFDQLIAQTNVTEAEAAFDPSVFSGVSRGVSEVSFPQVFPDPNSSPQNPTFFQTIVTNSTTVLNANAGLRGAIITGATWELRFSTAWADREGGGLVNPSYNTSSTLSVTQPILRGAWMQFNESTIEQARLSEMQTRQRFRSSVLAKTLEVEQAYWELVFARRDLEVKRGSVEVAQKLLDMNRVRVETGGMAEIEIVSAEAGLASRQTELIVAENTFRDGVDTLRRLILPFESLDEWDVTIEPTSNPDAGTYVVPVVGDCVKVALDERPDLAESTIALRNAALSVAVSANQQLPRLDFVGNVTYTGLSEEPTSSFLDSFGARGAESWNVGLNLEIPIGNRAAASRLARERLTRDRALMSYRSMQVDAIDAVRRAWRNTQVTANVIRSARETVRLRRQELKNEQVRLDEEVATSFQVLQVEETLAVAESQMARALVNYRVAAAQLANAMGATIDMLRWTLRP